MENTEIIKPVEYISIIAAALKLQTSISSFRRLLKSHNTVIFKDRFNGRITSCISMKDFVLLEAEKDSFRGNQHEKETVSVSFEPKHAFAEKGLEAMVVNQELMNDPFIQLRIEQIRTNNKVDIYANKVDKILEDQEQAKHELLLLPESSKSPALKSTRDEIRERVNTYAKAHGGIYEYCWERLNQQIYYRLHANPLIQAKNRKAKGEKVSGLDIIEELNLEEDVLAIACELFRLPEEKKQGFRSPYNE